MAGNAALETALILPILLLLIVGMVQIGKVTYTYYTVKKMVYGAARSLAVQQGINFCDVAGDATAQTTITNALNDPNTSAPIVASVTTLQVATQCTDPANPGGALVACDTSNCDALTVAARPDFLVVTVPGGYTINVLIPFLNPIPITFNPSVTVPFGGVA
jgi:Flp pilus assembly protein TadG